MISVMTSFTIKTVSKKNRKKTSRSIWQDLYGSIRKETRDAQKETGDSVIGRCECIHFLNHPGPPEECTEKV